MLQPPNTTVDGWVTNSDVSHHTTPSASKISTFHLLDSNDPSSIVVGNGFTLPVTSVGDPIIHEPFYLNNILLVPNIVQSLLFVRRFTNDNWCSMEFDPFGLSVKDLSTRNTIARFNSHDGGSDDRISARVARAGLERSEMMRRGVVPISGGKGVSCGMLCCCVDGGGVSDMQERKPLKTPIRA